jgi:Protein of unknown function, DUF481
MFMFMLAAGPARLWAQAKPATDSAADVLVLSNGDTLHGKFVDAIDGKVNFHSDPLGDISVPWEKIKELQTAEKFALIDKSVKLRAKQPPKQIPIGTIDVAADAVTVHAEPTTAPVPVKNAPYIVDEPTLNKQVYHRPGFFAAWNGAATAGATLVKATQNQYTVSGSLGMARVVPTAPWLDPRNRTTADFSGSYGKITEPAYTVGGIRVPSIVTKTAIYHADAERDQYLSPRIYALVMAAFDHNYAQNLQLQQIYGGGLGWTFLKTENQEADLKGTVQYEKQEFITSAPGANQDLIGSTFALSYILHAKLLTYTQGLAYIPAYNNTHAYSANETNTVAFPTYKNLEFSVGTLDSYLNNPPVSLPPTKRNSFQFTMGFSYAIKSKY